MEQFVTATEAIGKLVWMHLLEAYQTFKRLLNRSLCDYQGLFDFRLRLEHTLSGCREQRESPLQLGNYGVFVLNLDFRNERLLMEAHLLLVQFFHLDDRPLELSHKDILLMLALIELLFGLL